MASFSAILTAFLSFGITLLLGLVLIPKLKRLKFGQTIREDGPKWHLGKQGTPTMGGLMFIPAIAVAVAVGYGVWRLAEPAAASGSGELVKLFGGLLMALLFGLVGFLDDYIKVVKKRNLGLRASQKILLQLLVTALYLAAVWLGGDRSTIVNVPFLGQWDLGFLYFPVLGLFIIYMVNSVNLNDGIDGLCTSVTFVVGVFFMFAASLLHLTGIGLLATALAAACIAFLLFNIHPARVFMGDTGSMFLGGMVVALGFGIGMEFILVFAGFVYCFESLSVILQVGYFKLTHGKRLFKMSPIHHHFEMMGWSENKIVAVFSLITLVMCVLGFFAVTRIA